MRIVAKVFREELENRKLFENRKPRCRAKLKRLKVLSGLWKRLGELLKNYEFEVEGLRDLVRAAKLALAIFRNDLTMARSSVVR